MQKIVIVGAGMAGVIAALLLARRGHGVTLIERDAEPVPATSDLCFGDWRRPGVAQARQPHVCLGLANGIIAEALPDILEQCLENGCSQERFGYNALTQSFSSPILTGRRLAIEGVFRRAVERERAITVRTGAVESLSVERSRATPTVAGVRIDGETLAADLVIDATGRESPAPVWLAAAGARPLVEERHDCRFFYATRWYRMKPGFERPPYRTIMENLDFASVMLSLGDSGTFGVAIFMSTTDPLRHAVQHADTFERFVRAVPAIARWIDGGVPLTKPLILARIDNRLRRLVDDDGPVIERLVLLGDSAVLTNPTLARGISLAASQAQELARLLPTHADGPVAAFDAWGAANLAPWYTAQVSADAARMARWEIGATGAKPPPPADLADRMRIAMTTLSASDAHVAKAFADLANMHLSPAALSTRTEAMASMTRWLTANPNVDLSVDGPSRVEMEALLSS